MSLPSICAVVVVTAGSFFVLGAYYQHHDVLKKIQKLERHNAHAYFIRRKLYNLLGFFHSCAETDETATIDDGGTHKLGTIMKYGFPSMNEIRLKGNYVTSFDRRNSSIQWMCEYLQNSNAKSNEPEDTLSEHITGSAQLLNCESKTEERHRSFHAHQAAAQSEAARVFFMSNIKPFLNQGFNMNIWSKLQVYIQEMLEQYQSVYVYTGSIHLPKENDVHNWFLEYQPESSSMVAIPTHFFKIVIIDPPKTHLTPYAEAFVVPNSSLSDSLDLRTLLSDVRDIEKSTGLVFFEGLERNFVNSPIESQADSCLANT